jgi:hypothetical protein
VLKFDCLAANYKIGFATIAPVSLNIMAKNPSSQFNLKIPQKPIINFRSLLNQI